MAYMYSHAHTHAQTDARTQTRHMQSVGSTPIETLENNQTGPLITHKTDTS